MGDEDRRDRWLANILRAVLIGLFVVVVRGTLLPVCLGGLFALLLSPVRDRLAARLGPKRGRFAALILTSAAVVVVVLPSIPVVFELVSTVDSLVRRDWSDALAALDERVVAVFSASAQQLGVDPARIRSEVETGLRALAGLVTSYLGTFAGALPTLVLDTFLLVVSLYYFLRDGALLSAWLMRVLPFSREETAELFGSIHDTVNGAILGTIVSASAQGLLVFVAALALGVPGPVLLGVSGLLLAFVPITGTIPITLGMTLYLLLSGSTGLGVAMAISAVVIGNVDNVILPWIQSAQGRMHPLLVLLGIFGGLGAVGPAGIFIGPVVAAMAIWTIDTYAELRRRHLESAAARRVGAAPGPG
jgi:predicted PurR-regulated permease PerM